MQHKEDDPITAQIKNLQRPLGGRRLLSWGLFVIAAVVALLLPVASSEHADELKVWVHKVPGLAEHVLPLMASVEQAFLARRPDPAVKAPAERKSHDDIHAPLVGGAYVSPPPTLLGLDRVWNPGPLAQAHQPWANDCKVCHSVPFKQVMDKDCRTCHATIGDHVDAKAGEVHGLSDRSCTSCHQDHQGEFGLATQNLHFVGRDCAECHRDIKRAMPATHTENVADFATQHPQFRVQLAGPPPASALTRVRLAPGKTLEEPTGLKFPHDVHLSAKGIDSPKGTVRMECANCHVLQPDGLRFVPTNMKDHCQSCHALKLEPQMSNREVPHGSVPEVLTALREFYAYVAQQGGLPASAEPLTRTIQITRPGEPQALPRSFIDLPGGVRERAASAATELFEKTSCVVCHEVSREAGAGLAGTPGSDLPQWKIAPVQSIHEWMPKSVFNHTAHANEACTDCHQAEHSKKAAEVLMPRIEVCRDCHAGTAPAANKITSDCGLCHGFHQPARLPVTAKLTRPALLSSAHSPDGATAR